jgi:hypothetical protein
MNENLKDQDVLLVKEKGGDEVKAVKGIKNGKLETAKPTPENQSDFLKIDKGGNVLENFMENFSRQFKNPTQFLFFKAPADKAEETANNLQAAFKNPETPENRQFLDMHKVEMPAAKEYKISPELVDWQKFERFGITRENLEKSGNLDKLLDYQKTSLMPVAMKFDNETLRSDARFSLRKQEDGTFVPAVHLIRHKPDLERPHFGIQFTDEDRKNLLTTGNLGRIVEAEFKQGEKTPVLLSLDKQTNELIAYKTEWLKVPDTYKGAKLNEEQKQQLSEGKAVRVENMTSTKGKEFSANVQFNADKRYFELIFDNDRKQSQNQKQNKEQLETDKVRIPKKLLGVGLTQKQQDDLQSNKTIYVKGMVKDGQEQPFNAYIKVNTEKNKLDFFRRNPDYAKNQGTEVTPANESKTQVAVNSEGKTNEATKNAKEPLKQGQTQPTEKQAAKQEEKKEVKKSKGVKI